MSSFCEENSVSHEALKDDEASQHTVISTGRDFIPFHQIYWHQECARHDIADHPEQPRRTSSILNALRGRFRSSIFKLAPLASDEQILLFHTEKHLEKFKSYCKRAEDDIKCVHFDGDTAAMPFTRNAAYRAVGAAVTAVDDIFHPTRRHLKYRYIIPIL